MPIYEYVCDHCQCKFELLRSIHQSDAPTVCPKCEHTGARRALSVFAAMTKRSDGVSSHVGGGGGCASCGGGSCATCSH
jgi:putative FmdB family regulatory protein